MKKNIFSVGAALCASMIISSSLFGQVEQPTMYKGSTVNPGTSGSYYGRNVTATGTYSFAGGYWSSATGAYSAAMGTRTHALNTHAMAFGIDVRATANRAMIIGTGVGNGSSNAMINSTARSLMIGFNSNIPTVFVGSSSGLNTTGKVGIATTNFPTTIGGANISAYRLFVKGGILTEELRVRTGWADYVFEDNYQLKPLSEVEAYINENGHLPNVPSATQVEEEGISVGEMTKIQQEKIEELTLYIIEMKKEVEALKARLNDQENK